MTPLDLLREMSPWRDMPLYDRVFVHGWSVHAGMWSRFLRSNDVFVEVGAWLGKTSLHLLERYPKLTLIAIDTWDWKYPGVCVDDPMVQYMTNLWPYRDRCIPLCMNSHIGLDYLYRQGVPVDVVYIDGRHDYDNVRLDVLTAQTYFDHRAFICGDDFADNNSTGVKRAVEEIVDYRRSGRFWWNEKSRLKTGR